MNKLISKRKTFSLILPCFNEAENLPILVDSFLSTIHELNELKEEIELILVNNGSTDNSDLILKEIEDSYSFTKIIRIERNKGYGNGIKRGLIQASGEFIGWTHADLQTDLKDTINGFLMIRSLNYPNDIYIKGRRIGRVFGDQLFSDAMSIFESCLFMMPLYEINAQPNIFHRSFLNKCIDAPDDFSIDLYFYIKAIIHRLSIVRVKVRFGTRRYGISSWNINWYSKLRFIIRTILYSLKLRNRLGVIKRRN